MSPQKIQSKNAPVSLYNVSLLRFLDTMQACKYFEKKTFAPGEFLFREWEVDPYLYIIESWDVSIEKYVSSEKKDTYQIATLQEGDFFGEASFGNPIPQKPSSIQARKETTVWRIHCTKHFQKFVKEFPDVWYKILQHVIIETNKRLAGANALIVAQSEIERYIRNIDTISYKKFFDLIEHIKSTIEIGNILYFEKHQIDPNFLILKYDTRKTGKMQNIIFEKTGPLLDMTHVYEQCHIDETSAPLLQKVGLWKEIFWYILYLSAGEVFSSHRKKILLSITQSLSGVVKKHISDKEKLTKNTL